MLTTVKLPVKLSQNAFMGHRLWQVHECVPAPIGHGAAAPFSWVGGGMG
jgi:hypothetical protein